MKNEKMKNFLHGAGFLCVLLAVLLLVSEILTPKMLMDSDWPTTTTYMGFYDVKKDTVDVILLGSSRGSTELLPQVMYDEYGIRAYNLSCQQQNLVTSYYWLKEALRFQKPKAVVLETDFLFPRATRSVLNSSEGSVRVAFNHMKWSPNKIAAIHDTCRLAPNLSEIAFYIPFAKYHARWNELTEADFDFGALDDTDGMMGYVLQTLRSGFESYQPFEVGSSKEKAEADPIMMDYLQKIYDLCQEKNMILLLTEGLANDDSIEKYNTVAEFAEDHGIQFLDFNDKKLYEAVGADFPVDTYNSRHCNLWGAQKISKYIGRVLQEEYGIAGTEDAQWENTRTGYASAIQEASIVYMTEVEEYLKNLYNDQYTIFIAMQSDVTKYLSEEARQAFLDLGFECKWEKLDGKGLCAILEKGVMLEKDSDPSTVTLKGSIRDSRVAYELTSGGKYCSIKLNQEEKALRKNGINIVVYDNLKKKVLDSVVLTTGKEDPTVYRK